MEVLGDILGFIGFYGVRILLSPIVAPFLLIVAIFPETQPYFDWILSI